MKHQHGYSGANSCNDLKTAVLVSSFISSSVLFDPNSWISGLLGASKLPFVITLSSTTHD